jgi:hypothetical protein
MEPYKLSFFSLKSLIENLKVEILNRYFPATEGDPDTMEFNNFVLNDYGYWPTEKRYDLVINNIYHKEFLEKLRASFNALNTEIQYNIQLDQIKGSIPDYLENICEESTKWFESITELEIDQGSQKRWIYISKNIDQFFLKSVELNDYMIDDISYIFRVLKSNSLEIINIIERFTNSNYGKDESVDTEELISDIHEQTSSKGILDIYQTALLFFYLKKHQAINPVNCNSLAKYVSALTGHSEQNIRTNKGFGAMGDILSDKAKNQYYKEEPNYNLITVKEFMQKIVDDIEKQIVKNNKP